LRRAGRKKCPTNVQQSDGPKQRNPANGGAFAFRRSHDPNMGSFNDATILKSFDEVPANLDEL